MNCLKFNVCEFAALKVNSFQACLFEVPVTHIWLDILSSRLETNICKVNLSLSM